MFAEYEETLLAAGARLSSKTVSSSLSADGDGRDKMPLFVTAPGPGLEMAIEPPFQRTLPLSIRQSTTRGSSSTQDRTHSRKKQSILNQSVMQESSEIGELTSPLVFPRSLCGWQAGGSNPLSIGPREFHRLVSIMESCMWSRVSCSKTVTCIERSLIDFHVHQMPDFWPNH